MLTLNTYVYKQNLTLFLLDLLYSTFLETDTTPALNIINQDSTYFEIAGTDGQLLEYESVSARLDPTVPLSDQIENVPGGVILILFGVNAANEVIQNTVAWIYTLNYCDEVPLSPGAEVGWVTLESFDPPYSEFCDAATDPPTLTPSKSPTLTPSKSPTVSSYLLLLEYLIEPCNCHLSNCLTVDIWIWLLCYCYCNASIFSHHVTHNLRQLCISFDRRFLDPAPSS